MHFHCASYLIRWTYLGCFESSLTLETDQYRHNPTRTAPVDMVKWSVYIFFSLGPVNGKTSASTIHSWHKLFTPRHTTPQTGQLFIWNGYGHVMDQWPDTVGDGQGWDSAAISVISDDIHKYFLPLASSPSTWTLEPLCGRHQYRWQMAETVEVRGRLGNRAVQKQMYGLCVLVYFNLKLRNFQFC